MFGAIWSVLIVSQCISTHSTIEIDHYGIDCEQDLYKGFKEQLDLPEWVDVGKHFKATVINHLLLKILQPPEWSAVTASSRTPSLLSAAAEEKKKVNTEEEIAQSVKPLEGYEISKRPERSEALSRGESDKLMGQSTLDRLKEMLEQYFESHSILEILWPSESTSSEAKQEGSAGSAHAEQEAGESLQHLDFFSSHYSTAILDRVIGDTSFSIYPNISMTIDSAMVNLGSALCEAAKESVEHVKEDALKRYTCATHSLMKRGLICSAREVTPSCEDAFNTQLHWNSTCDLPAVSIHQDLKEDLKIDFKVEHLNTDNSLVQGNIDRWLLRAISRLYRYTKKEVPCGAKTISSVSIPGWEMVSDIWLDYAAVKNHDKNMTTAPFSMLLTRPGTCDFVVVNRGSVFKADWLIDFDYEPQQLVFDSSKFESVVNSTIRTERLGSISRGYARIAEPSAIMIHEGIRRTKCPVPRSIVFTGHSMGGVIGAAQALLLSSLYGGLPKLSVVAFGAPSAVDETFKQLVDERATVRAWNLELDTVTKLPCENTLPVCGSSGSVEHSGLPRQITISNAQVASVIPTMGETSFGTISYSLFTGELDTEKIRFPAPSLFAQAHTCAYDCWFNAAYCSVDAGTRHICERCLKQ